MNITSYNNVSFYKIYALNPSDTYKRKPNRKSLFIPRRLRRKETTDKMIKDMVIRLPDYRKMYNLIDELEMLGEDFIEICYEHGVSIYVLTDQESKYKTEINYKDKNLECELESLNKIDACGAYTKEFRLILINEKFIGDKTKFTAIHEMAHAYEDAITSKYIKKQLNHITEDFFTYLGKPIALSEYLKDTHLPEYFPNFISMYFQSENHDFLYKTDPAMFHFVQILTCDLEEYLKRKEFLRKHAFKMNLGRLKTKTIKKLVI